MISAVTILIDFWLFAPADLDKVLLFCAFFAVGAVCCSLRIWAPLQKGMWIVVHRTINSRLLQVVEKDLQVTNLVRLCYAIDFWAHVHAYLGVALLGQKSLDIFIAKQVVFGETQHFQSLNLGHKAALYSKAFFSNSLPALVPNNVLVTSPVLLGKVTSHLFESLGLSKWPHHILIGICLSLLVYGLNSSAREWLARLWLLTRQE